MTLTSRFKARCLTFAAVILVMSCIPPPSHQGTSPAMHLTSSSPSITTSYVEVVGIAEVTFATEILEVVVTFQTSGSSEEDARQQMLSKKEELEKALTLEGPIVLRDERLSADGTLPSGRSSFSVEALGTLNVRAREEQVSDVLAQIDALLATSGSLETIALRSAPSTIQRLLVDARERAFQDARNEGEALARLLRMELGSTLQISEPRVPQELPLPYSPLSYSYRLPVRFSLEPSPLLGEGPLIDVSVNKRSLIPADVLTYRVLLRLEAPTVPQVWAIARDQRTTAETMLRANLPDTFESIALTVVPSGGIRFQDNLFERRRYYVGSFYVTVRMKGQWDDRGLLMDRIASLVDFSSLETANVEASDDWLKPALPQLRAGALVDAERQAQELADHFGFELGHLVAVEEDANGGWLVRYSTNLRPS